jgi:predicted N-acetyltransferase YhbS
MSEEIKQSGSLTDEETQRLFRWGDNIFGVLPHSLSWRPKQLHFVLYAEGKPVSHVGLLKHVVAVNGEPVMVAGVGGVVTVPEAQKRGIARRLMQHAAQFLEHEWIVDAGLLFCLPKLEAYYARLGWQTIEGLVTIEQPKGRITSPLLVMVLPLGEFTWPTGEVDLQSLPW